MTESNKYLISRAAAAHMVDVDVRTLSTYQSRDIDPLPVAVKGKRGQSHMYDPQALTKWKVRQEIAKLIEDDDGKLLNLEQERARLASAQANKCELEVATLRGDLIPRELVTATWQALVAAARAKMLSMPTKVAHTVVVCETLLEVEEVIKEQIYEALEELATDGLPDTVKRRLLQK
jgi:phage terminase Nu1 subunit (DNA packaging protein)